LVPITWLIEDHSIGTVLPAPQALLCSPLALFLLIFTLNFLFTVFQIGEAGIQVVAGDSVLPDGVFLGAEAPWQCLQDESNVEVFCWILSCCLRPL